MQALLNALSSPGSMTGSQWLVLAIGLFIVLGSLYFVLKLFKILKGIGKSTYTPNIGLHRHPHRGEPVSKAAADSGDSGQGGGTESGISEENPSGVKLPDDKAATKSE